MIREFVTTRQLPWFKNQGMSPSGRRLSQRLIRPGCGYAGGSGLDASFTLGRRALHDSLLSSPMASNPWPA